MVAATASRRAHPRRPCTTASLYAVLCVVMCAVGGVDVEQEWASLMATLDVLAKRYDATHDPTAKAAIAKVRSTLEDTMTSLYEAPPVVKHMGGFHVKDGMDWVFEGVDVDMSGWDVTDFPQDLQRLIDGEQVDLDLTKYGAKPEVLDAMSDDEFYALSDLVEQGLHDILDRMEEEGGLFPDEANEKAQRKRKKKPEWRRFDDDDDDDDDDDGKKKKKQNQVQRKSRNLNVPEDDDKMMRGITHVLEGDSEDEFSFVWSIGWNHLERKGPKVKEAWRRMKNAELSVKKFPELRHVLDGHDTLYFDPLDEKRAHEGRRKAYPVVTDILRGHKRFPNKTAAEIQRSSFEATGHDLTIEQPARNYTFKGNRVAGAIWAGSQSYAGEVVEMTKHSLFVPHGRGEMNDSALGSRHTGRFENGLAEGRGARHFPADNCSYAGDFHLGHPHGNYAEYTCGACDGAYVGAWRRGQYHGPGEVRANGVVVTAEFVEGEPLAPMTVTVNGTVINLDSEARRGHVVFTMDRVKGTLPWEGLAADWHGSSDGDAPADAIALHPATSPKAKDMEVRTVVARFDGRARPECVRVSTRCPLVTYLPAETLPTATCVIDLPSGFRYRGACDGGFMHTPRERVDAHPLAELSSETHGLVHLEGTFRHGWYIRNASHPLSAVAFLPLQAFYLVPDVDGSRLDELGAAARLVAFVMSGDLTKPLYAPGVDSLRDLTGSGVLWYEAAGAGDTPAPDGDRYEALFVYDGEWVGFVPEGFGCLAGRRETVCGRYTRGVPHGPCEATPHNTTDVLHVTYEHGVKQGWGTWRSSVSGRVLGRHHFTNDRVTLTEDPPSMIEQIKCLLRAQYEPVFVRPDGALSDIVAFVLEAVLTFYILAHQRELLGLGPVVDGWAQ